MRHVLMITTALIAGGIALGVTPSNATAGPLPGLGALDAAHGTIVKVGYWRRYCKYNDCTGAADVDVDVTAPVVVTESPPVVAIVPVRPVSCGEFHYWNGAACVDARYNNPYIGPR